MLEGDLEHAAYAYGLNGEERSAKATAFLALLRALTNGQEPVPAIAEAIRVYNAITDAKLEDRETREKLARASRERAAADEEITRKVECPYCGAAPQTSYRVMSPNRAVRTCSHADRYRLARSLNDAPKGEAQ